MARKIKIPNERLKRFSREEEKRKKDIRNKRMYYLIVCEGEKTEPNYFEGLKHDLPKGVLTSFQIDIEGTGRNTDSLVDESLRLKNAYQKETGRVIDKLWVVFDKDSFNANSFNTAVNRCNSNNPAIGCAWSNEAFELWYLLHFHFYNAAMGRDAYQGLIEESLQPLMGKEYRYMKNSIDMYATLKKHGSMVNAIRNAKALHKNFEERSDYANHNPCTMVYALVEELLNLKEG